MLLWMSPLMHWRHMTVMFLHLFSSGMVCTSCKEAVQVCKRNRFNSCNMPFEVILSLYCRWTKSCPFFISAGHTASRLLATFTFITQIGVDSRNHKGSASSGEILLFRPAARPNRSSRFSSAQPTRQRHQFVCSSAETKTVW